VRAFCLLVAPLMGVFIMAENKKSIVIYIDIITTIEKLEDDEAGRVLKHLLRYVNDLNPEPPDRLTEIIFEPIKQQLKRDLIKWVDGEPERIDKAKKAGIASGKARELKRTQTNSNELGSSKTNSNELNPTKRTANVSVNDNVNVSVKVNNNINTREENFKIELSQYELEYGNKIIEDFFNYWTEKNGTRTKMLFEMQKTWDTKKRLARWSSHSFGKIIPNKIDKFDQLLKDLTNA